MTRMQAEQIAEALREYVDVMAFVATTEDNTSTKSLKVQRLTFEKLRVALVEASRHG